MGMYVYFFLKKKARKILSKCGYLWYENLKNGFNLLFSFIFLYTLIFLW